MLIFVFLFVCFSLKRVIMYDCGHNLVLEAIVCYFKRKFAKRIDVMPVSGFINKDHIERFL